MRIKLKAESNPSRSDFINASPIVSAHQGLLPCQPAPRCAQPRRGSCSGTELDQARIAVGYGCEQCACPIAQMWLKSVSLLAAAPETPSPALSSPLECPLLLPVSLTRSLTPPFLLQIEHDPRMPAYIATQGPLSHTIADFWQVSVTRLCQPLGVLRGAAHRIIESLGLGKDL